MRLGKAEMKLALTASRFTAVVVLSFEVLSFVLYNMDIRSENWKRQLNYRRKRRFLGARTQDSLQQAVSNTASNEYALRQRPRQQVPPSRKACACFSVTRIVGAQIDAGTVRIPATMD
jgi:hypothetical protein